MDHNDHTILAAIERNLAWADYLAWREAREAIENAQVNAPWTKEANK